MNATQGPSYSELQADLSPAPYTHLPTSFDDLLFSGYIKKWIMKPDERCALIHLLSQIRPKCAIEVGTADGGSLSVISRFSEKVYTIDIDPSCSKRLGKHFRNVEFVTGPSQETLPALLKKLDDANERFQFVLIDGDHSRVGVKRDIENLLQVQPKNPIYIIMHDSFMPECRQGMIEAGWSGNPYVHFVELDFITGNFEPDYKMTCGFAVALLLPTKRSGDLVIKAQRDLHFHLLVGKSINHKVWWRKIGSEFKTKLKRIRLF